MSKKKVSKVPPPKDPPEAPLPQKKKRPQVYPGCTVRVRTECGNMYITLNGEEGKVFEVFATLGKSGGCAKAFNEALTRTVTLALRFGVPRDQLIKQLEGIRCPTPTMFPEPERILSCPDAIARVLREYESHGDKRPVEETPSPQMPSSQWEGPMPKLEFVEHRVGGEQDKP